MSLSQREQAVGHGRGADRRDPEARQHGRQVEAAIEPVAELREVARQMLGAGLCDRCLSSRSSRCPRTVLIHLRSGSSTPAAPLPVTSAWCSMPASAMPRKQARPSLTTMLSGWMNLAAHAASSVLRNPSTTLMRSAIGWPSWFLATAAMKGVLLGEPRPGVSP
jgi:hypothetical protein